MLKHTERRLRGIKKSLIMGVVLGLVVSVFSWASPASAAFVAAPVFPSGPFRTHSKISLSSSTSGAKIYYTYKLGSQPSDPTSSSYLYNSSEGVDLQLPKDIVSSSNKVTTQGAGFKTGTYYIKAVAYYGSSKSSVSSASYSITNADQTTRNTLASSSIYTNTYTSGPFSGQNKPDCWTYNKHSNCTSFYGMRSATINEIKSFASACKSYYGSSSANYCGVVVTGGTEFGHTISSSGCDHKSGYKFDMRTASRVSSYITNKAYFTPIGNRSDGAAQYQRKSNGIIYANEGSHWDVKVGC